MTKHSDEEILLYLLSLSIDGELSDEENHRLQFALKRDGELRLIQSELLNVKSDIRLIEPPVSDSLREETIGKIKAMYSKPSNYFLDSWNQFSDFTLAWKSAAVFSGIAAIALIAVVNFPMPSYLNRSDPANVPPDISDSSKEFVVKEFELAQIDYEFGINSLEMLVNDHLETLPNDIASVFVENMIIVDQAILLCEDAISLNVLNLHAYQSLTGTYQVKIDLMLQILDA